VYIFGALLLLTLPLDWLMAALCAAAFHELCHLAVLYAFRGTVRRVEIRAGGAVIEADVPGGGKELLAILAGPAGSLGLLLFCHTVPKLALCAGVQGLFNLLPVWPLDGGRALSCCLELWNPQRAREIQSGVQSVLLLGAGVLALAGTFVFSLGVMPVVLVLGVSAKAIFRKRPCKRRRIGVQ